VLRGIQEAVEGVGAERSIGISNAIVPQSRRECTLWVVEATERIPEYRQYQATSRAPPPAPPRTEGRDLPMYVSDGLDHGIGHLVELTTEPMYASLQIELVTR
jgi:hypothetical protein